MAMRCIGFVTSRVSLVWRLIDEVIRHGAAETSGLLDQEVLFLVDGAGRFQAGALMARRALRGQDAKIGTVLYDWQTPIIGEVLSDLMWYRRNRLKGSQLARKLLTFRRRHPHVRIHLLAFSGGAGIATFALGRLRREGIVETLVLACPALSPNYNLGPALQSVRRCYVLTSHKDRFILGFCTTLFGTTDRKHTASGGRVGFQKPRALAEADERAYEKYREVRWTPELVELEHYGGHPGWASEPLLKLHLIPLLRGQPLLVAEPITIQQGNS